MCDKKETYLASPTLGLRAFFGAVVAGVVLSFDPIPPSLSALQKKTKLTDIKHVRSYNYAPFTCFGVFHCMIRAVRCSHRPGYL
jgi:hypothetical protein